MDAYALLGVARTQSLDEIEARFRQLVLENHPDRQPEAGPAAVADAERRTRHLTEAMAQIRADYAAAATGVVTFGRAAGQATSGAWVDVVADRSVRERDPVSCPHCDAQFVQLAEFEQHLATAHAKDATAMRRTKNRPAPRRRSRASRRIEGAIEILAILGACLVAVSILFFKDRLIAATGSWMGAVLSFVLLICGVGAVSMLVMRRSR